MKGNRIGDVFKTIRPYITDAKDKTTKYLSWWTKFVIVEIDYVNEIIRIEDVDNKYVTVWVDVPTLASFFTRDHSTKIPKCECGAEITYGRNVSPLHHALWCPKRGD